ncbi:hypothetical protein Pfo_021629, partial [Paulownia fortunei]
MLAHQLSSQIIWDVLALNGSSVCIVKELQPQTIQDQNIIDGLRNIEQIVKLGKQDKTKKGKRDHTQEGRAGQIPVPSPLKTQKIEFYYVVTCHASAPIMAKVVNDNHI